LAPAKCFFVVVALAGGFFREAGRRENRDEKREQQDTRN
jgi:hypothetical protein